MSEVTFPEEHKYLTFLKKVLRHEFRRNGFKRITTPTLIDNNLRENSEVWIMKAYLDNNIAEEIQPVYYYFMESFFPKQWLEEYRIGWEIIWENDPILDAIMIYMCYIAFNKINLWWKFKIRINSVWIEKEQLKFKEELVNFYTDKKHLLTEDWLKKFDDNILELLNSDNEDEKILSWKAPKMIKFLKKDSKKHYAKFKEYLDLLEIPYKEDNSLIMKNSYNTNTVWSIDTIDTNINLAYWARYDILARELWNPKDVPAVGFHIKTKKIIQFLREQNIKLRDKDSIDLFIVQLWDDAKKVVLPISLQAREAWINTVVSLGTPSMKEQMLKAQRSWAKYIVMVWLMEARNWIFQVRNTEEWTQEEVKKEDLIEFIIEKIWKDSLDFYNPARDLVEG